MIIRIFGYLFGLGAVLALISAGIVADHGGELTGENRPSGGAIFRASFPVEGEGT